MPKPRLKEPYRTLEQQVIETLIAGHHEWRPDLHYPESHSDMQGAVRGLLRMFEVKRRPITIDLPIDEGTEERNPYMHVLMFEPRFVSLVEQGIKRHTIRGPRARPIVAGDRLSLRRWLGIPYRSRQVSIREERATQVQGILIDRRRGEPWIEIAACLLPHNARDEFAERDGFASAAETVAWHDAAHGLPFEGVLIQW